jgi:hypothetical protein
MAAIVENFTEQAVLLGPRRTLVGIVTRPLVPPDPAVPAVVIFNTGIVHRVGHNRMYVTLARMLATAGRVTVRFDQSGLGDSGPRNDRLPPLAAGSSWSVCVPVPTSACCTATPIHAWWAS